VGGFDIAREEEMEMARHEVTRIELDFLANRVKYANEHYLSDPKNQFTIDVVSLFVHHGGIKAHPEGEEILPGRNFKDVTNLKP
jgi:hypothetical protein